VTALPRRMYRDPAEQLLEAEAETCKGCMFRKTGSDGVARCANPGMRTVLAEERCDEYEELQ
jgi:hypothetical protein